MAVEQADASGAFLHTQRGPSVSVEVTRSLLHKGQDVLIALKTKRVTRSLHVDSAPAGGRKCSSHQPSM